MNFKGWADADSARLKLGICELDNFGSGGVIVFAASIVAVGVLASKILTGYRVS